MALSYGAQAVWIGTRFVCSVESGASRKHKQAILNSNMHGTIRTEVYSGRPMRTIKIDYAENWEKNRKDEMIKLLKSGVVPRDYDEKNNVPGTPTHGHDIVHLAGQCSGNIYKIKSAKAIIEDIMDECVKMLRFNTNRIKS
eukprot:121865_1